MTSSLRTLAAALALVLATTGGWREARPDYAWRFPRDHWAHPGYRTEWWYFTGQLQAVRRSGGQAVSNDTAPAFGYQLTLFRVGIAPERPPLTSDWAANDLVMGHAAITDFRTGRHVFAEVLVRAVPLLGGFGAPPDPVLAWCRAPAGTDGRWSVRWTGSGFALSAADRRQDLAFDLRATPDRPLTLEGPNGLSRKGDEPGNASEYYSFTRLATSGALTRAGESLAVRGTSWMDHEFGSSQLGAAAQGWDWFSLELADGRDVMLYLMRDTTGTARWGGGTVVRRRGAPRLLSLGDFAVRPLARWTSPGGTRYPARWRLAIPSEGIDLVVTPLVADQENASAVLPRLFYWEGAVTAQDSAAHPAGRGYVELTGYGKGLRPAI